MLVLVVLCSKTAPVVVWPTLSEVDGGDEVSSTSEEFEVVGSSAGWVDERTTGAGVVESGRPVLVVAGTVCSSVSVNVMEFVDVKESDDVLSLKLNCCVVSVKIASSEEPLDCKDEVISAVVVAMVEDV